MKRRALLLATASIPFCAIAQAPKAPRRVGVVQFRGGLMNREGAHGIAFVAAMKELGYRERIDYLFDERLWEKQDEVPDLVRQLVRVKTDVILAAAPPSIVGAKSVTKDVPIVMMYAAEPVAMGLVASLRRPGGNITGIAWDHGFETVVKSLELMREALPGMRRVALMWDGTDSVHPFYAQHFAKGAKQLGMSSISIELRGAGDFEAEFARIRAERADAVVVLPSGQITIPNRRTIMALISRDRLPSLIAIIDDREWPGALLRYGPNVSNTPRRAAAYVDRIFKGARPADMPVEQPDKYDFIVDLGAARALGIKLPASVVARADQVLE